MNQEAATVELRPCHECGQTNAGTARFCGRCGAPTQLSVALNAEAASNRADPLIGSLIAERYRIVTPIGRGGMGVVYRAEHVRIGKLVAIKLLAGELARHKEVVKRFKREAELASRLSHPNTVQIFDFGRSELLMYLVMEYVAGRDLGAIVQQQGALAFTRAARIVEQVCASVAEAHDAGLIHRDLKPENVMVTEGSSTDFVKVLDFGLAKLRAEEQMSITKAGVLVGTPYYMAPEQIQGEASDLRSDIYSIGAMLYKLVAGVPPFVGDTPVAVLTKHITEPLVPPSRRATSMPIPVECDRIVMRAMHKDPRQRYQTVDELRDDLTQYLLAHQSEIGLTRTGRTIPPRASQGERPTAAEGIAIATKGEVDSYERRLRRRSLLGTLVGLGVMVSVGAAGFYGWAMRDHLARANEREPNNEPAQANVLIEGAPMTAYLGKRTSTTVSDADVFIVRNDSRERRVFSAEVTGVPNMDIVVDVVRAGIERPVLRVDSGGRGEGEAIPNFVIEPGSYFVRVREVWKQGDYPTENVSDPYTIVWRYVESGAEDEQEVNDSIELSNAIRLGVRARGYVGWAGDEDVYCLDADAPRVRAVVDGVEGLDLVISVVRKNTGERIVTDAAGPGAPESSPIVEGASARQTCFIVSASTARGGARANAQKSYVLHLDSEPR